MARLMPNGKQQFFDPSTGKPLAGGFIFTYEAGSVTAMKATYTTAAGDVPNSNPVELDPSGAAAIFWDGSYNVLVKDANNVLIYSTDNYSTLNEASSVAYNGAPLDTLLKNSIGRVVSSISALRALGKAKNTKAFVTGYYADGDGGGGTYYLDSADTSSADNGITVIVATDGARWKLAQSAPISGRQAGLKGDGSNEATQLASWFACGRALRWEGDLHVTTNAQVPIPTSNFSLIAEKGAKVTASASMQSIFLATDKNNVFVYGLEFDCGNHTNIGIYYRANTTNASGLEVYGCKLSNSSADATLQYGLVCVDAVGGAGGTYKPKNIKVNGNQFANGLTHGCLIAYADQVEFCGNWIDTMANHGMEAVTCTNVTISGNKVKNCTLSGLGVGTSCQHWEISGNEIDNCGGDGSITIEHNCVHGDCHDNRVTQCNTVGINFSFGSAGASPFDKIQRVDIHDNYCQAKPGVTTYQGINIYSSPSAIGTAINVHDNTFVGFNGGMTAAYLQHCSFKDNIVTDLTGSNSYVAKLTFVQYSEFAGWKCDTDTGDHSIQLISYAGNDCHRVNVHDNYVLASGSATKNLIQIDGAGDHLVHANGTNGSLHYINATGTASYTHGGNFGNLAGTPTNGGTANAW